MRREPIFGQISAEQQARIEASEARVQRLRERAAVVLLHDAPRDEPGTVNCGQCRFICNFSAERQSGWCGACRRMVSTWHPVQCQLFQAAA